MIPSGMRGIVLAGGNGTRLKPLTKALSKQLLNVYNKPMIYYPISTLMSAGIREIAIITKPTEAEQFKSLLGDGSELGLHFEYLVQPHPEGLAQAFLIASEYISGQKVALILGDNIFHGTGLGRALSSFRHIKGAHIFAYGVSNPQEYGVVEISEDGRILSIEEKPKNPKSQYAIPGLYFFDERVVKIAEQVQPSERGELEITSVISEYHRLDALNVSILPRGTAWLDTGTFSTLHDASSYIKIIEDRQGSKVGCIEEIAFRQNWITKVELKKIANLDYQGEQRNYLLNVADGLDEYFQQE
jgi:glucose-1-phosphate thymidylyltransferase